MNDQYELPTSHAIPPDYAQWLADRGALEPFLSAASPNVPLTKHFLSLAFTWSHTPQGTPFWNGVNINWMAYRHSTLWKVGRVRAELWRWLDTNIGVFRAPIHQDPPVSVASFNDDPRFVFMHQLGLPLCPSTAISKLERETMERWAQYYGERYARIEYEPDGRYRWGSFLGSKRSIQVERI